MDICSDIAGYILLMVLTPGRTGHSEPEEKGQF